MLNLYKNCLKPRFDTMKPATATQFETITHLTNGLNQWLRNYFIGVNCDIFGVVTYPTGTTFQLGTAANPLKICKPVFETFQLLVPEVLSAVSVPSGGLANLFNYIGLKITATLTTWTAAPLIPGVCICPLTTAHFFGIAQTLFTELSQMDPDPEKNPDITEKIWNKIQEKLEGALKKIITVPTPYIGAFGPGVFNGIAKINLNRTGV